MKKWIVGAALIALGASAFAGFVDERKQAVAPPAPAPAAATPEVSPAPAGAASAVAPVAVAAPVVVPVGFAVLVTDRSVRDTLTRWATSSGWMHLPEHWTVSEDYSVGGIAGPEVFGSDFRQAVRTLISSTDMTARPAQPCFYSNQVVRVIPRAGICDPSAQ